jgi:acetylornithine/succinyldiaminopimelate/putrescine aminotransferase
VLILDEIQSGLGRTGDYLASQGYGVKGDIVILAKPLGGGLPLGAFVAREEIAAALTSGMHGTTFGGGPLACRVALEFLAVLKDEKVLQNVRRVGRYFRRRLEKLRTKHALIREVRGRGLMLAIDLSVPSRPFVLKALDRGVIINSTHDTVLRFLPPLIVEEKHVDSVCDLLDTIFAEADAEGPKS